jgi:hypothetical protein
LAGEIITDIFEKMKIRFWISLALIWD